MTETTSTIAPGEIDEVANRGLLMHVLDLAIDSTERALQSAVELVEGARREIFHITFAGLDFVETAQQSVTKVVRDALGRADRLSAEMTGGSRDALLAAMRSLRSSGELAGDMVGGSVEAFVGRRSAPKAA